MTTSELVTVFGILITCLLTAAGGVGTWAALRVGRNAQTLRNYRDAADSWKEKSDSQDGKIRDQESEITRLQKENGSLRNEIAELRGQINVLTSLVKTAITEMASNASNKDVLERLEKLVNVRRGSP
jgi:predicted RNase H-like nuclease (RuvC/YqgF family)